MYEALLTALRAIKGLKVAEYEWRTRPDGDYCTVQLDFEASGSNGDDVKQDRAFEGSVDLYTKGKGMMTASAVESALESVCEGSWELNSEQYEHETGLIHREFVFQMEAV